MATLGQAESAKVFPQFTLCTNSFCGVLSEAYPNRLAPYSGTSGGNTSNSINNSTFAVMRRGLPRPGG